MDKNHSNKNDNTEEDEEEEEEEESEDEEETSQSDDSSHDFHRGPSLQNHNQQQSSSTSSSAPSSVAADSEDDLDEKLCPAAQLLLSRKPSPKRKNNSISSESSPNHKGIQNIKSSSKRRQHNHTQTEDIITDTNTTNNNHINSTNNNNSYQRNRKASQSSRMNSIFMEDRLDEEDEDQEDSEDDRPIRGSMKVREDTMDGAENPDTDPPQRRRTLEDISITELSTLRASLPPEYPEDESPPTLLPCLTCNRTFNPKALDRHRTVCQKISQTGKKKQVFNALTQRFEGLDSSPSPGTGRATTPERKTTPPSKKASRWREKHQEFLRTIRAARGTPEGDADVGAPVPSVPSDYIKCPCCERHFGPKAAERHIDWCKEQSTRLRRNSADTHLVERLKTRTKYVPPKPGQSGWRAPKKTDVISSIPPPATGDRRISPPPGTPSALRRGISPGPPAGPRHPGGTASLGRSAARSFSSLLQAVTGSYASPYGQRPSLSQSGYATPSSYSAYGGTSGGGSQTPNLVRSGSFSGMDPEGTFARSASLRLPNTRRSSGGRIARRRDLASDMLASVCLGGNPARGEPEGNEADDFSSRETTLSPPPYTNRRKDSKSAKNRKNIGKRRSKIEEQISSRDDAIQERRIEEETDTVNEGVKLVRNNGDKKDFSISSTPSQQGSSRGSSDKGPQTEQKVNSLQDETKNSKNPCGQEQDDLEPNNYESEVEIEIPTEENYLKSSASVSGDDDVLEGAASRPRSVHFEDEYWEKGQYVSKALSKSDGTLYTPRSSNVGSRNNNEYYDREEGSSPSGFSFVTRPSNVKSARGESVREMLRKRREGVEEVLECDGRRRIKSLEETKPFIYKSRSSSRERLQGQRYDDTPSDYRPSDMKKSQSMYNVHSNAEGYNYSRPDRPRNRGRRHASALKQISRNPKALTPVSATKEDAGFISSKRYAILQSLVGSNSNSSSSSSTRSLQRENQKRVNAKIKKRSSRQNNQERRSLLESKFDSSFVSAFNSEYDSSKYDSSFDSKYESKYDTASDVIDTSYDPYSAAEMQMQALLGPTQGGGGLGSTGLGAAGLGLGKIESFLDEKKRQQTSPKKRLSKLNTSLSPVGRRSSRQMSPSVSDILSSSPGPDYTSDKRNWRLSPSPPPQRDRWSPSPQSPTHVWSPTRSSPGRWGNESPCWNREDRLSITSLSGGSRDGGRYSASSGNTSNREDRGLSPSTNPTREDRFSLSSGGSGSLREDRYSSGSLSRDGRFSSISSASYRTDRLSTGSNPSSLREDRWSTSSRNTAIRRTSGNGDSEAFLGRKSSGGEPPPSSSLDTGSSLASLKALRTALQGDGNASKKYFDSLVEPSQPKPERTSSGSSTDSSLPLLSSRSSSVSPSGTAKGGVRGDAVGGHSEDPLITPRIEGATRTERSLFASSRVASNPCGEESLQKAISSLSSIGEMPAIGKSSSLSMESRTTVGILDSDSKAPKFCYECGHKYPVSLAKFCCHCGCRRAPVDN